MTEDFGGGFFDGHVISQDDAMAELESEGQRIRDRMAERRAFLEIQARSDELKASLCNKIQEEKAKIPGLRERINALETSDPELYKFIRKLEYIQDGIWCPTCNKQKTVGPRPPKVVEESKGADASAISEFLQLAEKKITNLAGKFMSVLQEAEEYRQKLADATVRAQAIEDEFIKFKNRMGEVAGTPMVDGNSLDLKPKSFDDHDRNSHTDADADADARAHSSRPTPAAATPQVPAWMREKVDTRPSFDLGNIGTRLESTIDAELDKKYESTSSDDLLN